MSFFWEWTSISVPARLPQPCTVRHLVESYLDITAVPRRSFFELMSTFATNDLEKEKLMEFSSVAGQEELHSYCNRPRRTALEVQYCLPVGNLTLAFQSHCVFVLFSNLFIECVVPLPLQALADFPHTTAELKVDCILDLFPEIQPRSFSIASSLQVIHHERHLLNCDEYFFWWVLWNNGTFNPYLLAPN